MPKSTRFAAVSVILLALTTACSSSELSQNTPIASTSPKLTAQKASIAASPKLSSTPQPERFQDAVDTAISAATITQSAESKDDWNLVVNRWETAIKLLKTLPKSSPNYPTAQKKIPEYQRNLAYAQQQEKNALSPRIMAVAPLEVAPANLTPSTPKATKVSRQTSASIVAKKVALANHLKRINAKFYATFWCPYCNKQKEMFGEQAFRQINYIECDPRGNNPRPNLCQKAKIRGFPTWELNNQQYPGMLSLEELATLSGYQGDRNFGN
jgi:thiol-disulfide isomerase/thioredoxin